MRKLFAILCVAACFSTPIAAQEAEKKAPPAGDLVDTAKAAKAKRKQSSTKVITNKDVKKSKGKLIALSPSKKPAVAPNETTSLADHEANFHARKAAIERVDAAQKKVDGLQKELETIEQQYYEENDPNRRDNIIQQQFAQTKRQLESARSELADARDVVTKLTPQTQK